MVFTAAQIWGFILALIGLILTVLNIIDKIATIKQRSTEPERVQNARLDKLELDVKELRRYLDNDKHSIDELRATNNMSMKVLFALLNHSIHNDNMDELKSVQKEMQSYLTSRGVE